MRPPSSFHHSKTSTSPSRTFSPREHPKPQAETRGSRRGRNQTANSTGPGFGPRNLLASPGRRHSGRPPQEGKRTRWGEESCTPYFAERYFRYISYLLELYRPRGLLHRISAVQQSSLHGGKNVGRPRWPPHGWQHLGDVGGAGCQPGRLAALMSRRPTLFRERSPFYTLLTFERRRERSTGHASSSTNAASTSKTRSTPAINHRGDHRPSTVATSEP